MKETIVLHLSRKTQSKYIEELSNKASTIESRIRNREELENLVKQLIAGTGVPESYIKEDVDPEAFKKAMYNSLVLEGYIPRKN